MTDWYDTGKAELFKEASEETELPEEKVKAVYSFLSEIGIIDYDIEKDVVFDRYCSDEEA